MSYLADLRADCNRRLAAGIPGVYVTLYRDHCPRSEQVRLTRTAGPLSYSICVVKEHPDGGWQVTALFRPAEVLAFLDRMEGRAPVRRSTWHDVVTG